MDNYYYKKTHEGYFDDEKQLLTNFLNFVGDSIIVAHNAIFDFNFIIKELEFHNLPLIPKEKFRCTMRIFKSINNQKSNTSLDKCCDFYNLASDKAQFHSAIYDTLMCSKIFCKMLDKTPKELNTNTNKENKTADIVLTKKTF